MTPHEGIEPNDHIGRYKRLYLRGLSEEANLASQLNELQKRKKRVYLMLVFNIIALFVFGFSFYSGQTQLDGWVIYAIFAMVALNLFVMNRQLKQINALSEHLKSTSKSEEEHE